MISKRRSRRIFLAAQTRFNMQREADKIFEVRESFSTEWMNTAVSKLWPAFLEQYVSRIAKEQIQKKLNSLKNNGKLPGFMERMEIEEFTLGTTPPILTLGRMHGTPARDYLRAAFLADWVSSSFRVILCVHLKPSSILSSLKARFEVRDITVNGEILFGVRFNDRSPGIMGIDFSFSENPKVDLNLKPLGLAVSQVPGIATWLNELLTKGMARLLVEPKRLFIPVERVLLRQAARKGGGPGGLLTLTVIQAQNIGDGTDQSEDDTCAPYVEVRIFGRVFRTHRVRKCTNPKWNRNIAIQLPLGHFLPDKSGQPAGKKQCCPLGQHCMNCQIAVSLAEGGTAEGTVSLGTCTIDLSADWIKLGQPGENRWYPLTGSGSKGSLQLRLTAMPPTPAVQKENTGAASVSRVPEKPVQRESSPSEVSKKAPTGFAQVAAEAVFWVREKKLLEEEIFAAGRRAEDEENLRKGVEGRFSELVSELEASRKATAELESKLEKERSLRLGIEDDHRRDKASWEVMLNLARSAAPPSKPEDKKPSPDPPEVPDGVPARDRDRLEAVSSRSWSGEISSSAALVPSPAQAPSRQNWKSLRQKTSDHSGESTPTHDRGTVLSDGDGDAESDLGAGTGGTLGLEDLRFQVVQLQSQVEDLVRSRADLDLKLTEKRRNCKFLEGELDRMIARLSEAENEALRRGALFVKHGRESSDLRRVSVNEELTKLIWVPADISGVVPSKVIEKRATLSHVERVEAGTLHFPGGLLWNDTKSGLLTSVIARKQSNAIEKLSPMECFSIVFQRQAGIPSLNLEVPKGGNGRSRDEWVSAFQRLLMETQKRNGNGADKGGTSAWKNLLSGGGLLDKQQ